MSNNIQNEAHKVLKSDSTQTIDHTRPPYFFGGGAEAASRSTPLFKMEPCIFFFR